MLTFEQALEKAQTLKENITGFSAYKKCYSFTSSADAMTKGGDGPVVIVKETGDAINFVAAFYKGLTEGGIIRDGEIKKLSYKKSRMCGNK